MLRFFSYHGRQYIAFKLIKICYPILMPVATSFGHKEKCMSTFLSGTFYQILVKEYNRVICTKYVIYFCTFLVIINVAAK